MKKFPALIAACACAGTAYAQTAPATYWIRFTDKANTPYSLSSPGDFLSQRSIDRRDRQGIAIDSLDLPVDPAYISALLAAGAFDLVNRHKWFNAVTIRGIDTLALDTLDQLPFVAEVRRTNDGRPRPARATEKFPIDLRQEIGPHFEPLYGASFRQVEMMNMHLLHGAGARGQGMLIGILDSGFEDADSLPAFAELRAREGIVMTRDMAYHDGDVYNDHWHGRSVLSCIAGHVPGELLGTAPMADVALFRTEVSATEYLWEEDNWVSGAEAADSLGCDVLNTSLGYTQFDDSTQDHSYADMDGLTTRISIAAGIAARKGMIPVQSAGNNGSSDWHYIGAPADAIDILAVGATGTMREIAPFSSHGPSFDGRVKPDVAAVGWGTIGLGVSGTQVMPINGTSFSSPLVAGSVACLWQLHPDRTAQEIMAAVRQSASRHDAPDDDFGHGIPDFWRAHLLLDGRDLTGLHASAFLNVWPVPFSDHFIVELFSGPAGRIALALHDATGRLVWEGEDEVDADVYLQLRVGDERLQRLNAGIYILRASSGHAEMIRPIIKVVP